MPKEDGQFKPGNPGGGRTPGMAAAARRVMDAIASACDEDAVRDMVQAQVTLARQGDAVAFHALMDRILGKPKQSFDANIQAQFKSYLGFNPVDVEHAETEE